MNSYDAARDGIKKGAFERATLRPQTIQDWKGPFPLPPEVERYYRELGPVDVVLFGVGNNFFLPRLRDLWKYQAGYRYHPETNERFPGWDDDWLVVADEGSDPFVFSRSTGRILHACHGEGSWKFTEHAPDLHTFITALATLAAVIRAHPDEDDEFDEWMKVLREAAHPKLEKLFGAAQAAQLLSNLLGGD